MVNRSDDDYKYYENVVASFTKIFGLLKTRNHEHLKMPGFHSQIQSIFRTKNKEKRKGKRMDIQSPGVFTKYIPLLTPWPTLYTAAHVA